MQAMESLEKMWDRTVNSTADITLQLHAAIGNYVRVVIETFSKFEAICSHIFEYLLAMVSTLAANVMKTYACADMRVRVNHFGMHGAAFAFAGLSTTA